MQVEPIYSFSTASTLWAWLTLKVSPSRLTLRTCVPPLLLHNTSTAQSYELSVNICVWENSIAQRNAPVELLEWNPQALTQVLDKYILVPGHFPLIGKLMNSGEASHVRSSITSHRWLVVVASYRSKDSQCHATSCEHTRARTLFSSVDLFQVGASLNIDEFIPYPAHRSARACVKAFWSLNLEFANITFRDFSRSLAELLKEGVYVRIKDEIMRVVNAGSKAVEGKLLPTMRQLHRLHSRRWTPILTASSTCSTSPLNRRTTDRHGPTCLTMPRASTPSIHFSETSLAVHVARRRGQR